MDETQTPSEATPEVETPDSAPEVETPAETTPDEAPSETVDTPAEDTEEVPATEAPAEAA